MNTRSKREIRRERMKMDLLYVVGPIVAAGVTLLLLWSLGL